MVAEPLDNIYLFIFPPFPYKFHCTFECVIHTVYSSMQRRRKTWIILKEKNMKVHRSLLYLAADIFPLENFLFLSFDDAFPFYLLVMLKRQEIQSRGVITP